MSIQKVGFALLFIGLSLLLFFKIAGNAFVADTTGWIIQYQKLGWKGIFNSFEDKSLHHVYHLATFLIYKTFGFNQLAWWLIFGSLHGINAYLVFLFVQNLLARWQYQSSFFIAIGSGLLFLVSPYNAEPVIWSATIHYLIATAGILAVLVLSLKYAESPKKSTLVLIHLSYLVALFALEITFALPFLLIALLLLTPSSVWKGNKQKIWLRVVLVQIVLIGVYFVTNRIVLGKWIGHYGAEDHLGVSIPYLSANFTKYLFKHLLFSQFWDYPKREFWYYYFEKESVSKILLLLYLTASILLLLFKNKLLKSVQAIGLTTILFAVSLLPVISLYFNFIVMNECDRMSYFSTVFSSIILALLIAQSGKFLRIPLLILVLAFSFSLLKININSWKNSIETMQALVNNFRWHNNKNVVILSIADNFRGAYVSRSFKGNENFKDVFRMYQIPVVANIIEVLNFNMNNENDCMKTEALSPSQLKVSFAQGGNWFWYNGIGASSYETDLFKVEIDEWSSSYTFTKKAEIEEAIYIYQCGKTWHEVKLLNNP
jgi:hypothetical protein